MKSFYSSFSRSKRNKLKTFMFLIVLIFAFQNCGKKLETNTSTVNSSGSSQTSSSTNSSTNTSNGSNTNTNTGSNTNASTGTTTTTNPPAMLPVSPYLGRVVIVGYGGLKMTTDNQAANWLQNIYDVLNGGDDQYLIRGVHYANNLFVAVGYRILTSADGITWKEQKLNQWLGGVTYGNGRWVAAGGCGSRMYSDDGLNWKDVPNSYLNGCKQLRKIIFGNNIFLAYGENGTRVQSSDGINWTDASVNFGTYENLVFGNGLFYGIKGNTVYQSSNGQSWALVPNLPTDTFNYLSYSNGRLFFIANGGTYYSSNGTTWLKGAATYGEDIVMSNNTYYSFGWVTYYKSTDLKTWQSFSTGSNSPAAIAVAE